MYVFEKQTFSLFDRITVFINTNYGKQDSSYFVLSCLVSI